MQSKNFPPNLKQHKMPKLNNKTKVADMNTPSVDKRLINGMMNFTEDQQETIKAFFKQQRWKEGQNDWFSKKNLIQLMDKKRRKTPEKNDQLETIVKRKN